MDRTHFEQLCHAIYLIDDDTTKEEVKQYIRAYIIGVDDEVLLYILTVCSLASLIIEGPINAAFRLACRLMFVAVSYCCREKLHVQLITILIVLILEVLFIECGLGMIISYFATYSLFVFNVYCNWTFGIDLLT